MNLFIAYTPLHVLIIESILTNQSITDFNFIFFFDTNNKKNKYYFSLLSIKAKKSFYIKKKKSPFFLIDLFLLSKKIENVNETNIYTGNLKTIASRFLIFLFSANIYTFDDGSANIIKGGYLYDKNENNFSKLFFSLFNKSLLYNNIFKLIKTNYTIYDLQNIYPNCKRVTLKYESESKLNIKRNDNLNILLGGVLSESKIMTLKNERLIMQRAIEVFKITHYIPHPRNRVQLINNKSIIEITDKRISEEVIMCLKNDYNSINVYGIYSTALLNLTQIPGICITNLDCAYFSRSTNLKEIFNSIGIETVDLLN